MLVTKCNQCAWHTGRMANNGPSRDGAERLSADDRREALLEVTKALVLERGTAAITMGAVAERAEVTRALVYKHFANSEELLASLYRRESKRLDRAMSDVVTAAPAGFEAKLRALVRAALAASEEHGVFFTRCARSDRSPTRRPTDGAGIAGRCVLRPARRGRLRGRPAHGPSGDRRATVRPAEPALPTPRPIRERSNVASSSTSTSKARSAP